MKPFSHFGNSQLLTGQGVLGRLVELLPERGSLFIVTGHHFLRSESWDNLQKKLKEASVDYDVQSISGEPSPAIVDELTEPAQKAACVAAIGGGSVLDTAKAVAAMVKHPFSVMRYLEGVGDLKTQGKTLPVIAVPTTAGTGSETTKNAVISQVGPDGFKKSLRDDAFVPHTALLDPSLSIGCPPEITLSCAMDALCQLLESRLSTAATPLTEALSALGLSHFQKGIRLLTGESYGESEIDMRAHLAFAAWLSGLTLSNAGLGTVHGIAGPLGAVCPVPHGVACALLMPPVFQRLLDNLSDSPEDIDSRNRFLESADTLLPEYKNRLPDDKLKILLEWLHAKSQKLPRLSSWGLNKHMIRGIVASSDNKNFPVKLTQDERQGCLEELI